MAGQRPGIAKHHRAFGNPLDGRRAEWFAARTHWHIEVIRGSDAERGGALAHPSDSPANERRDRWSEWRSRQAGPAPDDIDRQDAAAGYQSRAKLSVAGASSSVGPNLRRPNFSDPSAECNYSRGCKFRKLQSAL